MPVRLTTDLIPLEDFDLVVLMADGVLVSSVRPRWRSATGWDSKLIGEIRSAAETVEIEIRGFLGSEHAFGGGRTTFPVLESGFWMSVYDHRDAP